jgi:hypothetical protein
MDGGRGTAYSIGMVPLRLRVIALVAAYAVALQGLLAAFSPGVAAWSDLTLLCSQQASGDPAGSGGHDEPLCKAACVMHGAAAAPSAPDVAVPGFVLHAAAGPVSASTPDKPLWRNAPTARAPPSV